MLHLFDRLTDHQDAIVPLLAILLLFLGVLALAGR